MKRKKQPKFFGVSQAQFWKNWREEALYSIPMLLGLAIMVLFPTMWGATCGVIVMGFTGIIIIYQRKAPSAFMTIEGTPAVLIGALLVIFLWGGALAVILARLFHW